MSGEVSLDRRLSPSGRFVRDVTSGMYLPIGSGTPGLIWRGQLTTSPTNIGGTAGDAHVNLPGQGGAWELPAGYRYDIQAFVTCRGKTGSTTGNLYLDVEGSEDGGSTWTRTLLSGYLPATFLESDESACFSFGWPAVSWSTVNVTNVRTRALRIGVAATDTMMVHDSWTKITQYVT